MLYEAFTVDGVQVKTRNQIWQEGVERVRHLNLGLHDVTAPNNADAGLLLRYLNRLWMKPQQPVMPDQKSLDHMVDEALTSVEQVWETRFIERPQVRLLPLEEYLPTIKRLDEECVRLTGSGRPLTSPPSAMGFPYQKMIVVPAEHVLRKPRKEIDFRRHRDQLCTEDSFEVMNTPWDNAELQYVVTQQLSRQLFRQLRGEWGDGYLRSWKDLAIVEASGLVSAAVVQVGMEHLTDKRKEWSLCCVTDMLFSCWSNAVVMNCYRSIDALRGKKSLAAVSHADMYGDSYDVFSTEPGNVLVMFYVIHPDIRRKKRDFGVVGPGRLIRG